MNDQTRMNDQTQKRVIGLAVLIIVVVGLPLVLSNCYGPGNESTGDGSMRQITIDVSRSDGASGAVANTGSKPKAKSEMPDFSGKAPSGVASNQGGGKKNRFESIVGGSGITPSNDGAAQAGSAEASSQMVGSGQPSNQQASSDNAQHEESQPVSHESRTGESEQQATNATSSQHAESETAGSNGGSGSAENSAGGSGEWVVQVASFKSLDQARTFISRMSGQYASFYAVGEVDGVTYYRVRVGPFVSEEKAERVADKLATENRKPYVVHR